MLRIFGVCGFGFTFLLISSSLRNDVIDAITAFSTSASVSLAEYSPFSYVGVGVGLIVGVMVLFRRAASPR